MFEYKNFENSLIRLGANPDRGAFEVLQGHYGEPTRFYHDASHIAECLLQFQKFREQARHPEEIELAIWFHDAIYDTRANDNEEQSAELAERFLRSAKAENESIARIVDMILATKTHEISSPDSMLMVDIDLGILGATEDAFETYDQNIRKEYSWVPVGEYRAGRSKILRSFSEREIIFHNTEIRALYEAQARQNLSRKISELGQ